MAAAGELPLHAYMRDNFEYVNSATQYSIVANTRDRTYNCFAFAVGITNRQFLPYNWEGLQNMCK
jgi:hypothetical protein